MGALTGRKPRAFAEYGKKLSKKVFFTKSMHFSSPTTGTLAIKELRVKLKSSGVLDNNDANFRLHLPSRDVIKKRGIV